MVYINLPPNLTEEEGKLRQKHERLRKKAIKLSDKKERKDFKRSRNLEKKPLDSEKTPATPATVGFQPFGASHPEEEKRPEREERVDVLKYLPVVAIKSVQLLDEKNLRKNRTFAVRRLGNNIVLPILRD